MQAEKVSLGEKMEIMIFKFVSIFPVIVTFGLFGFLSTYYIYVCMNQLILAVLLLTSHQRQL